MNLCQIYEKANGGIILYYENVRVLMHVGSTTKRRSKEQRTVITCNICDSRVFVAVHASIMVLGRGHAAVLALSLSALLALAVAKGWPDQAGCSCRRFHHHSLLRCLGLQNKGSDSTNA